MRTLILALIFVGQAHAADAPKASAPKVTYDKKTHFDFDGKNVDGQFLRPDGQAIRGNQDIPFDNLVKSPNNFSKQQKRSSGALR